MSLLTNIFYMVRQICYVILLSFWARNYMNKVIRYWRKWQSDNNLFFVVQGGLKTLLEYIKDKDPDKVSVGLASSLDTIAQLELLQVILITVGTSCLNINNQLSCKMYTWWTNNCIMKCSSCFWYLFQNSAAYWEVTSFVTKIIRIYMSCTSVGHMDH